MGLASDIDKNKQHIQFNFQIIFIQWRLNKNDKRDKPRMPVGASLNNFYGLGLSLPPDIAHAVQSLELQVDC